MGVPPTNRPPSSSSSNSSSSREPEGASEKKSFRLNKKSSSDEKGSDDKDETLFDLKKKEDASIAPVVESAVAEMKEFSKEMQTQTAQSVQASESKAAVTQIASLIQKMVGEMRVWQVGGQNFAQMTLQRGEVPECFANGTLTLNMTEQGLHIQLMNLTSAQESQALVLIDQNREALVKMVQNLESKNISVSQMNIGGHAIALPSRADAPAPIQPANYVYEPQKEKGRDQDQEQQGGGKKK